MKIYVDCDDTLILYMDHKGNVLHDSPHPYGEGAADWMVNAQLVRALGLVVLKYPDTEIVVWSGGGYQYAGIRADQAFFQEYRAEVQRWSEGWLLSEGEHPWREYPQRFPDTMFHATRIHATSKNDLGFRLVKKGDIVIDDMPLSIPCDPLLLTPEDFIVHAPRMVVK